jgi:hypothetical protein
MKTYVFEDVVLYNACLGTNWTTELQSGHVNPKPTLNRSWTPSSFLPLCLWYRLVNPNPCLCGVKMVVHFGSDSRVLTVCWKAVWLPWYHSPFPHHRHIISTISQAVTRTSCCTTDQPLSSRSYPAWPSWHVLWPLRPAGQTTSRSFITPPQHINCLSSWLTDHVHHSSEVRKLNTATFLPMKEPRSGLDVQLGHLTLRYKDIRGVLTRRYIERIFSGIKRSWRFSVVVSSVVITRVDYIH